MDQKLAEILRAKSQPKPKVKSDRSNSTPIITLPIIRDQDLPKNPVWLKLKDFYPDTKEIARSARGYAPWLIMMRCEGTTEARRLLETADETNTFKFYIGKKQMIQIAYNLDDDDYTVQKYINRPEKIQVGVKPPSHAYDPGNTPIYRKHDKWVESRHPKVAANREEALDAFREFFADVIYSQRSEVKSLSKLFGAIALAGGLLYSCSANAEAPQMDLLTADTISISVPSMD